MKRTLIFVLSIVLIVCTMILSKYYEYKQNDDEIKKFNVKYERYLDKEILGTDIATIVNQAVDDNEQAFIKKDENGKYIQDNEKYINIEIKITDLEEDKIYTMETLYHGGMGNFALLYDQIKFKCGKIEYNSKGKVKYMLFEQISS